MFERASHIVSSSRRRQYSDLRSPCGMEGKDATRRRAEKYATYDDRPERIAFRESFDFETRILKSRISPERFRALLDTRGIKDFDGFGSFVVVKK